jgi:hypothetical protein
LQKQAVSLESMTYKENPNAEAHRAENSKFFSAFCARRTHESGLGMLPARLNLRRACMSK